MPGGGAPAQHQPPQPDIGPAGCGVVGKIHRCGNEWAAVLAVLEMDRKPAQVHAGAGRHHLLHRSLVAADLDDFRREPKAAQDFMQQHPCGGTPKAPPSACGSPAHCRPARWPPASSNSTAFGLASSACAIAESLVVPPRRWSPSAPSPSTKLRNRNRSKSIGVAACAVVCSTPIRVAPRSDTSSPGRPWRAAARPLTWSMTASSMASIVCGCQHGTVITSPTPRFSIVPPAIATRHLAADDGVEMVDRRSRDLAARAGGKPHEMQADRGQHALGDLHRPGVVVWARALRAPECDGVRARWR